MTCLGPEAAERSMWRGQGVVAYANRSGTISPMLDEQGATIEQHGDLWGEAGVSEATNAPHAPSLRSEAIQNRSAEEILDCFAQGLLAMRCGEFGSQ
ncbi:hypothetical protein XH98_09885 [Bradyrhizobium sp. CCBAU 51745]|nr:hypothetical protein [Bradyrhizobium sp. CCBAU 51745]